jgi:DNA-binding phage protein
MDAFNPFDGVSVEEAEWRAFMRRSSVSGVLRNVGSELATFGDSTGMQVKVPTGEVWTEGHWGSVTAQKTLAITSNSSGNPRKDLVVARCDFANNRVELDVLVGTPAATPLVTLPTQSVSIWEVPLAIVTVASGAVTIAASNVADARQWGGPPVATGQDDFLLYGDRVSSANRIYANTEGLLANGEVRFIRFHSLGAQTVTRFRCFTTVAQVAGTTEVRLFRGLRGSELSTFQDVTVALTATGMVDVALSSSWTLRPGEMIVAAFRVNGASTQPKIMAINYTTTTGNWSLLNPDPTGKYMLSGFKTTSMPSSLNIHDGSWSLSNIFYWCGLS